ncbi:MAG: PmoA family protein [Planctomycetaceae bacterium]|nr:PmoA family protein [Planctomycetaceae bacterium]
MATVSRLASRLVVLCIVLESSVLAEFQIVETDSHGLRITHNGHPFAEYVVDQGNKPYLWRVHGPTGKLMTRAYPMEDVEGERKDHPHHRGITFGHEGINGVDTWAEEKTFVDYLDNPNRAEWAQGRLDALGRIVHREYEELSASAAQARFVEICDYHDRNGQKILAEKRTVTFRVTTNHRWIDFDQELIASEGDLHFEDKKDSGLSIRIPTSMDVDSKLGGKIINSEGQTDKEAWSQPANWCDYHGPVDGETVGVAILNHPSSFRHPTRWHVRTYGLFTANPFASKQFDSANPDAAFVLKQGESLKLFHRFVFHSGNAETGKIAEAYDQYASEKR